MTHPCLRLTALFAVSGAACAAAPGAPAPTPAPTPIAAAEQALGPGPCAERNPLKNAYFGDLHTHTSFSLDAYVGANRSDPAAAFAYARGTHAITIAAGNVGVPGAPSGPDTTLARALDFLAVTDHSEWLQADYGCTQDPASAYYNTPYCQTLRTQGQEAQALALATALVQATLPNPSQPPVCAGPGGAAQCNAEVAKAWLATRQAVVAANDRCHFTSFLAYEWTNTLFGDNLHRNVLFKDLSAPAAPFDYLKYPSAQALWGALNAQCTGGREAMTIPHNSNASGGQMFVFSAGDVANMKKYQTLVEIHQHKGSSECVTDTADTGAVSACTFEVLPNQSGAADVAGYVRPALEAGLAYHAQTGQNPLQLGLIAATDTHNSTPGNVDEAGWPGHLGLLDNTPERRVGHPIDPDDCAPGELGCSNPRFNPGGLTGVWAEENTREALWAALKRREVFGTSGPRIKPRFYQFAGGFNPCADAAFPAQVVAAGGVPMGGTMSGTAAPRFVAHALADVRPLQRIDIIKASVHGGATVEKVYSLPPGASNCVTWTDPAFNAADPAFYYARFIEQPGWRWSHQDCLAVKASHPTDWETLAPGCALSDPAAGGLDYQVQERAWTSPIWYLP